MLGKWWSTFFFSFDFRFLFLFLFCVALRLSVNFLFSLLEKQMYEFDFIYIIYFVVYRYIVDMFREWSDNFFTSRIVNWEKKIKGEPDTGKWFKWIPGRWYPLAFLCFYVSLRLFIYLGVYLYLYCVCKPMPTIRIFVHKLPSQFSTCKFFTIFHLLHLNELRHCLWILNNNSHLTLQFNIGRNVSQRSGVWYLL